MSSSKGGEEPAMVVASTAAEGAAIAGSKVMPEGMADMLKIVVSTMSRSECHPFNAPVDWKSLQLTDYLDIVKEPRDLGTIKKTIEDGGYASVDECVRDIRLVWRNCMVYNREGSEFYHLADTFAKAFEDAYAAIRKHSNSSQDMERLPSVEERMVLSYDIFKINNMEMARVLTMIEAECPSAMAVKKSEEVIINFDTLTSACFHKINLFVQSCIIASGGSKKKRPPNEGGESGGGGGGGGGGVAKKNKKS